MGNRFATKHGYDPFLLRSAIQKAIRRGDEARAFLYAFEMCASSKSTFTNTYNCLWCVLHEDIGIRDLQAATYVAANLPRLREAYDKNKDWDLMLANIIMVMCRVQVKSHEGLALAAMAMHELDGKDGCQKLPKIPDEAYDMHTQAGRAKGRGIEHWMEEGRTLLPEEAENRYNEFFEGWALNREEVKSRPYAGLFPEGLEEPNRPTDADRAAKRQEGGGGEQQEMF